MTGSLINVEGHLVGAEGVGQGERADAHRLELGIGLEPVGVGGLCGPRRRSIVPYGEFPHVFGADVNVIRPDERPVSDEHLIEERLVVQASPIGLVEVPRTIEDGLFTGVEHDIDLVAVQRFSGHYVVDDFHRFLNVADQS